MRRHKLASRGAHPNGTQAHIALARCAPAPRTAAAIAVRQKTRYSTRLLRLCIAILALYGSLILLGG